MPGNRSRQLRLAGGAVALFIVCAAVGAWSTRTVVDARPEVRRADPTRSGRELVMIYVGKAACGWCNRPEVPGLIADLKQRVRQQAEQRGRRFVFEGLALDRDPNVGVRHLAKFGDFDQVFAGGSWGNEMAFKYLWNEMAGVPATPTILITERFLRVPDTTRTVISYRLDDERLLVRKVGLFEIQRWLRDGAPVPRIVDSSSAPNHAGADQSSPPVP